MTANRPATRYRPAWRFPVDQSPRTIPVGHVEMTAKGFARRTEEGFVEVERL